MKKRICKLLLLGIILIIVLDTVGCTDKQSNLNKNEIKILNSKYTSLTSKQKNNIPSISEHMNLHDWDKYGTKLEQLYIDQNINDLAEAGSTDKEADKKIGESEYKEIKTEAIKNLEGKSVANNKISTENEKETLSSNEVSTNSSKIDETANLNNENSQTGLTQNSINLVTNSLKQNNLIEDVAIKKSNDGDVVVAVQVNSVINKDKAKELIENTARQLGAFCGGKSPEKYYLGEIWEKYDGIIIIFSGENNIMLKGYVAKGAIVIRYSDGTSLKLME
ncbi:hypothetical protein KM803_13050 [Clostridium tyrobutyricum]|uniref:hypothetical protein n=1 Tax=Clostridium tyrobutyricum TaxID=1519 RepID=UPI001C38D447|nr:hypothetical protein [Clostridium tyrobutyricum]MBV4432245.1 hypothetical protein [Clostridium tyrobutyricum]